MTEWPLNIPNMHFYCIKNMSLDEFLPCCKLTKCSSFLLSFTVISGLESKTLLISRSHLFLNNIWIWLFLLKTKMEMCRLITAWQLQGASFTFILDVITVQSQGFQHGYFLIKTLDSLPYYVFFSIAWW